MLFDHYTDVPSSIWRWENFSPSEFGMHCRCCGEFYLCEQSLDMLQKARTLAGKPFHLNSGHRCGIHNARVGGAPLSMHKKLAFDISLTGHDKYELLKVLKEAGFTTFGFYKSFIHIDIRPNRKWFGQGARKLWKGYSTY